jgi:hypothetical protein
MGWEKATGVTAAILLAIAAPAMAAQDVGKSQAKVAERAATGTVIAVTPESRTVVVEATLAGKPWILGVEVPENVAIAAAGKTRKLEDLKTGERVRLRWIREENRLVAESIAILGTKAQ